MGQDECIFFSDGLLLQGVYNLFLHAKWQRMQRILDTVLQPSDIYDKFNLLEHSV